MSPRSWLVLTHILVLSVSGHGQEPCELALLVDDNEWRVKFSLEADLTTLATSVVQQISQDAKSRDAVLLNDAAYDRVRAQIEQERRRCARRLTPCALSRAGDVAVERRECKILISGTGRSGTTFLVKLLTALGLDTDWDLVTMSKHIDDASGGGLESKSSNLRNTSIAKVTPKVLKTLVIELRALDDALARHLEFVIMPYRNLANVAESRARIGGGWGGLYRHFYSSAQEIFEADNMGDLEFQRHVDTQLFLAFTLFLIDREIPHLLLSYRRMFDDAVYLYESLAPLMRPYQISFEIFEPIYAQVRNGSRLNGPCLSKADNVHDSQDWKPAS